MTERSVSGDLSLAGSETPPVTVADPEDVFLQTESVSGDLRLTDVEYVFTNQSVESVDDEASARTTLTPGEDAYVEFGGVDGDLTVEGAGDVFVPADAAAGGLDAVGAENVYRADGPESPRVLDVVTNGWKQTATAADPDEGVYVTGAKHEVSVKKVRTAIDVYVVGYDHEVEISGREAAVNVHFVGRDNTVSVGPYLSASVESDAGFDNALEEAPYPVEDLIEQTKSEATRTFGRHKIIYQRPASDEDWCPNCGEPADAIVERHQMEAFFLLGYPLKVYDRSTNPARECEHCSPNTTRVELNRDERREILG
ncbi:hypothetical protein [Halogeometricum limi]|uniref:DUF8108 domain-containing protein n=1 Tax=Halogeometricum limi TaxID=555875 RepID=A0A1I6IM69_9EURY|nr:hypothetical protein [Halogeometricum limi]SFR67729.1 hypothetical protein SAMN04488124_3396 [Halogeometricum limi]